jgi:hypothetical protein
MSGECGWKVPTDFFGEATGWQSNSPVSLSLDQQQ